MTKKEKLKLINEKIGQVETQIMDVRQRLIVFKARRIMDREITKLETAHRRLRAILNELRDERALLSKRKTKSAKKKTVAKKKTSSK